jgi:hypothetical protein
LAYAVLNKCSPFSSPIITTSHHPQGISPLFQPMASSSFAEFAMVLLGFLLSFDFAVRISV